MATKSDVHQVALEIYLQLRQMPYCTETSTAEQLRLYSNRASYNLDAFKDMFELHNELMRIIKAENVYEADFNRYLFQDLGLPYNIPFIFRLKYPVGMYFFRMFLDQYNNPDIENDDAISIVEITDYQPQYFSYDKKIPLRKTLQWIEKAYNKKKRLIVVPDPEFLSGKALKEYIAKHPEAKDIAGSCANQYDGWSYHFELDDSKPFQF